LFNSSEEAKNMAQAKPGAGNPKKLTQMMAWILTTMLTRTPKMNQRRISMG